MYRTFFNVTASGVNRVYFMFGQSNMGGKGALIDLPARLDQPLRNCYIWNTGAWEVLEAGVNGSHQDLVGPIFEFAYRMREKFPNDIHYFVFHADASLGLAQDGSEEDWSTSSSSEAYDTALGYWNAAKATIHNYTIIGLCWMQGERDSRIEAKANAYNTNEETLFTAFNTDFGADKVVVGKLHDSLPAGTYPYVDTVNTAKDTNIKVHGTINTDSFGLLGDNIHFDTAGAIELGQNFADFFPVSLNAILFSDEFDGSSVDDAKWRQVGGSSEGVTRVVTGGNLQVTSDLSGAANWFDHYIESIKGWHISSGEKLVLSFRVENSQQNDAPFVIGLWDDKDSANRVHLSRDNDAGVVNTIARIDSVNDILFNATLDLSSPKIIKIIITPDHVYFYKWDGVETWDLMTDGAISAHTDTVWRVAFAQGNEVDTGSMVTKVDRVYLTNYDYPTIAP
jgi:hypothetical protein